MSDTENKTTEATPEQQTDWGAIIKDMLILIAITGAIGGLCNLAMMPFEAKTPTDSLISLIGKGGQSNKDFKAFYKELQKGTENAAKENKVFINIPDQTGRTPLMWAAYANFNAPNKALKKDVGERVPYVEALLKVEGIDVQAKDNDGFTALHWAAWSGMPATSYLLIKAGLNVNQPENNGYTPLMLAALRGNAEVVRLLLQMGADASIKNAEGLTAEQLVTNSESAYKKRDDWKYSLIFSEARELFYNEALAYLKNPPAMEDPGKEAVVDRVAKRMKRLAMLNYKPQMQALVESADEDEAWEELAEMVSEMATEHKVKFLEGQVQGAENALQKLQGKLKEITEEQAKTPPMNEEDQKARQEKVDEAEIDVKDAEITLQKVRKKLEDAKAAK